MYVVMMNEEDTSWPNTWIVTLKEYLGFNIVTVRIGIGVRHLAMYWHVADMEADGSLTYI